MIGINYHTTYSFDDFMRIIDDEIDEFIKISDKEWIDIKSKVKLLNEDIINRMISDYHIAGFDILGKNIAELFGRRGGMGTYIQFRNDNISFILSFINGNDISRDIITSTYDIQDIENKMNDFKQLMEFYLL